MPDRAQILTAIRAAAAPVGLNLCAAVPRERYDARVEAGMRTSAIDPAARSIVVLGNGGGAFWQAFKRHAESHPGWLARDNPLDDFTRDLVESTAHTIGILPGYDHSAANPHIEFAIATGLSEARNAVVIGSADAVVALEGEGGTLSEIGFALKIGRPLVALRAWPQIEGIQHAEDPAEAVGIAVRMARLGAARQVRRRSRAKGSEPARETAKLKQ